MELEFFTHLSLCILTLNLSMGKCMCQLARLGGDHINGGLAEVCLQILYMYSELDF